MNLILNEFNDNADWQANGSANIPGPPDYPNQIPEFIAGFNNSSVVFHLQSGGGGEVFHKNGATGTGTLSVDVTGFNEISFSLFSRFLKGRGIDYLKIEDFVYKLSLGGGNEFLIPTPKDFDTITLDISSINTITDIKFEALHDFEDYLIISHMVAFTTETPKDIYTAVQTQIQKTLNVQYPDGLKIADAPSAGQNNDFINIGAFTPEGRDLVQIGSLLKIKDASNEEIHQIENINGNKIKFTGYPSGAKLVNDFTNPEIFVVFSVLLDNSRIPRVVPSITLSRLSLMPVFNTSENEMVKDTARFDPSGMVTERKEPINYEIELIIDIEVHHSTLKQILSDMVRVFLSQKILWMNGSRFEIMFALGRDIEFEGFFSNQDDIEETFDQVQTIQYTLKMELKEDVWPRKVLPEAKTAAINVEIQQQ